MADVPYQQAAQVEQAQAELENAKALGLTDRQAAAEKILDELGAPKKRAAAARRAGADDDEDEAKKSPPEGRSARSQETTAEPEKRGPGRPRKTTVDNG